MNCSRSISAATSMFAVPAWRRAAVAAVVACGLVVTGCGGGSDSPPAPAPAPAQSLGPGAGSVTSSDGKVTLTAGDNALQAATAIVIVPAEPDAATAADPSLVPGTTYEYTAPDLQVPEQVLIRIDSPHAVAAAAATMPGRASILALPAGWFPPPTCLVNSTVALAPVQNVWVDGEQCPQAPAPACLKILTVEYGNTNPFDGVGTVKKTLCAPAADLVAVPGDQICPSGYREVTGEVGFETFAAQHSLAKICERLTVATAPVLGVHGTPSSVPCTPRDGYFLCATGRLPSGRLSVLWDRTPPPPPLVGLSAPATLPASLGVPLRIVVPEDGTPTTMTFTVKATDPDGLGAVELVEASGDAPLPSTYGAGVDLLPGHAVWSAPRLAFSGAPSKTYESGPIEVPWSLGDPVVRIFFFRVFDRAGNSLLSTKILLLREVDGITIDSLAFGTKIVLGGAVPGLVFKVKGAAAASIDHGAGSIATNTTLEFSTEGFLPITPVMGQTYTLTATHPSRATKTATYTYGADTTAPAVQLFAAPTGLIAPATTTLSATASDAVGVTKVEFFRGTTLIATDTSAPYAHTVALQPADAGTITFTAKAYDAASNVATSNAVNVAVGIADVTPPTVSLVATPATLVAPGVATLQATAADAGGIARVEFYRGTTLLATTTLPPHQTTVALTAADTGSVSFTARAIDTAANSTVSAPAVVVVGVPTEQDTYVSPGGIDAGNTTCAQASPCRSIAQAAATGPANKTVWLNNGIYDASTQPAPIQIPAGTTLRALTPGLAGIGQGIVLQGSASIVGVVLRRNNVGDFGAIAASTGTLVLDGIKASGSAAAGSGFPAVLALSGTVHATMTPGSVADYCDQLAPIGQGTGIFATLAGTARLSINGGTFGGAALGGSDGVNGAFNRGAFNLTGSSRLDLNNVVLNVDSSGIFLFGDATQVHLNGSLIHAFANSGPGYGIYAAKGTPQVTMVNSQITGFAYGYSRNSVGISVGTFAQSGVQATVTATNSSVTGSNLGVFVTEQGSSPSSLTLTGSNLAVDANTHGGIVCRDACNVDLSAGSVSANATNDPAAGSLSFQGGIWMGMPAKAYALKLRNVAVVDNKNNIGGNAAASDNSGVTMAGNGSSGFDLGNSASPGNNVITGNTSSAQTAGLNVAVAPGVTVRAVGNTFIANAQGADALGKYQLGTAPCGPSSCALTSGAGINFRINSGSLQLAP